MMQTASQITLCLMLIVTTAWCIIVYRKLATMKSDGGPIRELIQALNQTATRADQTILAMRLVIKDADTRLAAMADFDRVSRQREIGTERGQPLEDQRRHAVLAAATRQARAESQTIEPMPAQMAQPMGRSMDRSMSQSMSDGRVQVDPRSQPRGPTRTDYGSNDAQVEGRSERSRVGRQRRYEDVLKIHHSGRADEPNNQQAGEDELERLAHSIASLR